MLSIQPKINVSRSQYSFTGNERNGWESPKLDENIELKASADYYKAKAKEFKELEDSTSSKNARPLLKASRIICEGAVEGTAVVIAGKHFSSFIGKSASKFAKSGFVVKYLNPFISSGVKFVKAVGNKVSESVSGLVKSDMFNPVRKLRDKITASKFAQTLGRIGGKIKKVFKPITDLFKKITDKIGSGLKNIKSKMTYNNVSNAVVTTTGLGTGVAGAYASAIDNPENEENKVEV